MRSARAQLDVTDRDRIAALVAGSGTANTAFDVLFNCVDEIAVLAVYLASDESAFTTGATHIIDGGWTN